MNTAIKFHNLFTDNAEKLPNWESPVKNNLPYLSWYWVLCFQKIHGGELISVGEYDEHGFYFFGTNFVKYQGRYYSSIYPQGIDSLPKGESVFTHKNWDCAYLFMGVSMEESEALNYTIKKLKSIS